MFRIAFVLFVVFVLRSAHGMEYEFRALWADAWHKGVTNRAEVAQLVKDVRAANCNSILFQVRKRGDAYYGQPSIEPVGAFVESSFDPLREVIRTAHDTNDGPRIEVHAWFVTYPIATKAHASDVSNPMATHADWLSETDNKLRSDGDQFYFDPGHPAVQQYLFGLATNIISNYDLDGFHFDYVRYPGKNWGYNKIAVARFNKLFLKTGVPAASDPDWTQFRRDQVTALIRKVYLSSAATKPRLKISASTITGVPGIASDQAWKTSIPYSSDFQDWRGWMEEGILDMNISMCFFMHSNPMQARAFYTWTGFVKNHAYGRQVSIGVGGYINSISGTSAQVRVVRKPGLGGRMSDGIALYSYAVPSRREIEVTAFSVTGSKTLFPSPATVPDMPWKTHPATGHLKGFLYTGKTTNVLDGATVTLIAKGERTARSDGTGFYGFVDVPPGDYSVVVSVGGANGSTNRCTITKGKVTNLDFHLD